MLHVYIHTISLFFLSPRSKFGQIIAQEFLKFFEFEHVSLDNALRQFLSSFSLTGESQERERVMTHFSQRYFECNPDAFPTQGKINFMCLYAYHVFLMKFS